MEKEQAAAKTQFITCHHNAAFYVRSIHRLVVLCCQVDEMLPTWVKGVLFYYSLVPPSLTYSVSVHLDLSN